MEITVCGEAKKIYRYEVVADSGVFIGVIYPEDSHRQRAKKLFQGLKHRGISLVTTSAVIAETATVLSHRKGQNLANFFLQEVIEAGEFPVIFISEDLHFNALDLFSEQTRRGTSVTDCANIVVMRRYEIKMIFSFDQGYYPYMYHLN